MISVLLKGIIGGILLICQLGGSAMPLKSGEWRATLLRPDGKEIVFNFIMKDSAHKQVLYIRNAGERLLVDDIVFQGDSVWIHLPFFEAQLRARILADGNLQGVWLKRGADSYQVVPFTAVHDDAVRFVTERGDAVSDAAVVTGRWRAEFRSTGEKTPDLRVGEFVQHGNIVTGTFLDPTGDFRYLEGAMDGDSLRLSCFDGGHAYLFTARLDPGGKLSGGQFFSGAAGYETWTAVKDEKASLPDEFTLTKWKKDAGPMNFTFRDIDGHPVSFSDARFRGKVVLIQIMGSWCPNCMDETQFLSRVYDDWHKKGVEIVGLAYERSTDFARSRQSLRSFQQRFNVKYPLLITGVAVGDPQRAEKTLPQLEKIVGFPTTIFVDKTGKIEKIHTGFSGPGTGTHYAEQQEEFKKVVEEMRRSE